MEKERIKWSEMASLDKFSGNAMDRKCFKSCFQKKIWLLTILLLLKDLNTICFQSMNLYVLIFSFLPQNQQRICMYWFVIHFLPCLNKNCSHAIKVKDKVIWTVSTSWVPTWNVSTKKTQEYCLFSSLFIFL